MNREISHNEKELLCRLVDGDMQAFDDLYWKYQQAVYQNVFKINRNAQMAEDIVQEVFISLWEKRKTIDTNRSIAGWLFVSSYNRSVNALKKKLRESLAYKALGQLEQDIPYDQATADLQLKVLENAILKLSPQQRRVFEICKLQGRSYEEAAAELKISKHTVKEYLSAAITSVKEFTIQHPGLGVSLSVFLLADCFLEL